MDHAGGGDRRQFVQLGLAGLGVALTSGGASAQALSKQPNYLVVYLPGPAWIQGKSMQEQPPLKEHGRYMLQLYRQGVLQFAGRFGDNIGGAMAFTAKDDAEANAIVAADPAVTSGMFTHELRAWVLQPWADIAARSDKR